MYKSLRYSTSTTIVSSQYEVSFCNHYHSIVKDVQVDSCTVGIENIFNIHKKKIINNYNILGKSRKINSRDLNIIIYNDGTVKKKIIIK